MGRGERLRATSGHSARVHTPNLSQQPRPMLTEAPISTSPAHGHKRSNVLGFGSIFGKARGRSGAEQAHETSRSGPSHPPISLNLERQHVRKRSRSVQSRASSRNSSLGGGSKFERDYQSPKFVRGRAGSGSDVSPRAFDRGKHSQADSI